jgi:glycosyltransferase involved in cell wall biosynthesis
VVHGDYDIVHSHGYKADIYCSSAVRGARRARVATVHNWPTKTLKMRAYASIDKFALRSFSRVVAVSVAVAQELVRSGVPLDKVKLIENGVDPAAFRNGTDRVRTELNLRHLPVIGYIGRLAAEKGLDVLFSSIPGIVQRCPEVQVILAGDGPIRNQLTQSAQKLGIGSHVRFLGVRSDMADLYRAIDVLVLPSRDEGLPMTVLEALAAGKAVVASSVGQIPQVIRHGETGLLVQAGSREQLADAILELLGSPQLRKKLGSQGRQLIDSEFTAEAMARKYIELYRSSANMRA